MKKSIFILLFALLNILSARAYDFKVDGIYYRIISGADQLEVTCEESGKASYSGSVAIPSTVTYKGKTYTVTSIGYKAFSACTGLRSVSIPNSVTSIESAAFKGCTGLTSVTIPESVTSIHYRGNHFGYHQYTMENAFSGCTSISSPLYNSKVFAYMPPKYRGEYTIPSGIQSIVGGAFTECSGLTLVTIPESVTSIGDDAFIDCTGLTSVTIPENVTSIGRYAFHFCTGLTSVTMGESVTSIGAYAFNSCSGLTSVTIPESVDTIGDWAFGRCTSLSNPLYNSKIFAYMPQNYKGEYTIPSGIQSIVNSAFYECEGLTSVTIPNSVTTIGDGAFGHSGLESMTIPEGVTSIGQFAFRDCSSLMTLTIPHSVTSIGYSAFVRCRNLRSVEIFSSYIPSVFLDCSGVYSLTIGESVDSIDRSAFHSCTALRSVTWNARHCQDFSWESPFAEYDRNESRYINPLTSITFGSEVEHIPAHLCSGGSGLTSVTIPESVTSIGAYAFAACSGLTSVTIPESVTSIGGYAFYDCTAIPSPLYNSRIFVYMPQDYSSEYTIPSGIQSIAPTAFYGCTLMSVTIPKSVDTIGGGAFNACTNLTSVTSLARKPPHWRYSDVFPFHEKTLYVPHGCKDAYEWEWGGFNFEIEELPSIGTATVMVNVNDAAMGRVTGDGEYELDEEITLKAIPNPGYHFEKWDDGSTDNPRLLTVTHDITLTATFAKDEEKPDDPDNPDNPTANEPSATDNFRVYVQDRTIHLSEDRVLIQVYNMAGQCVYNGRATAIPVPQSGVYIVAAGSQRCKVLVR